MLQNRELLNIKLLKLLCTMLEKLSKSHIYFDIAQVSLFYFELVVLI